MSPRPKKTRKCTCILSDRSFKPAGIPMRDLDQIHLFMDEIEAIKLCDLEGLTQQEAGDRMGVSRGTVQRTLSTGRTKVAEALTSCKALVMEETVCEKQIKNNNNNPNQEKKK